MRLSAVGLLALLIGLIAFTGASYWWMTPAIPCMVGVWLMRRDRCEHLYPALLPAIRHADGTTLPAKWFCCDCGDSWAAGQSPVRVEQPPIPRLARSAIMSTTSSVTGSPSDQVA